MRSTATLALVATLALTVPTHAQRGTTHVPGMTHTPGMERRPAQAPQPTQTGQAAFAAISEIVSLLEADSTTDWTRVDLEALRQHLIDMDAVTMRARVMHSPVPGGVTMQITGTPDVAAAARRMIASHAPMLQALGGWRAATMPIADGIRLTVTVAAPSDAKAVARIRGLGFIGLMVQGEHHTRHHLMIARGGGTHPHEM